MNARQYDVVIVGAGHNGLVAAGYLARAGLSVVVLERRGIVGGAVTTEELIPGFRFSACAMLCYAFEPEIVRDLDLKRHGFESMSSSHSRCDHFRMAGT